MRKKNTSNALSVAYILVNIGAAFAIAYFEGKNLFPFHINSQHSMGKCVEVEADKFCTWFESDIDRIPLYLFRLCKRG